jgi:AcrR family transcriptional regulator
MARPRQNANAIPTVQRILSSAEQAFAGHGYERARLADIARGAGITRPSLLYHFKSKDVLYVAVLAQNLTAMTGAFDAVMSSEHPYDQQLLQLIQAYVDFLESRKAFSALILRELVNKQGRMRAPIRDMFAPVIDNIERWVVRSGRTPPAVPARAALMHLATDALVRTASGDIRGPLWGPDEGTIALARRMLLAED